MNITVQPINRQPIDGIARSANVLELDDQATVAVAMDDLITSPRPGQKIEFLDSRWTVLKTASRTRHVLTFIARRMPDGR